MQNIPHSIPLAEAIELTSRFQADRLADMSICETFEKDSVRKMLQAEGADKLRIYYGRKEDGSICAVLVAADGAGNDLLPKANKSVNQQNEEEGDEYILENSYKCPPACPPESPLNNH